MGERNTNGGRQAKLPRSAGGPEVSPSAPPARKRAILDLAPLELDCMNALWPLGEASVRKIRERLAPHRPRAYTTIMTIMDRLAQKGVVSRKKVGRAYFYAPNLTIEHARSRAVALVVEGFFGGSAAALREHLGMPPVLPSAGADVFEPAAEPAAEHVADTPAAPIDKTLL